MNKQIIVGENESVTVPILWAGDGMELGYDIHLAHRGASVSVVGLLLGKMSQELALTTNIYHEAPQTTSEVIVRGALTDKAKINFEGLVKIQSGAKGTKAWLAAHLLLLSDQAKGRAVPSLEILENDVKAGHATTVGRVNEMELFYLQSRGLNKNQAKQLIIEGYLLSIIEKLPKKEAEIAKKELTSYVSH